MAKKTPINNLEDAERILVADADDELDDLERAEHYIAFSIARSLASIAYSLEEIHALKRNYGK